MLPSTDDVLAVLRTTVGQRVLCLINLGAEPAVWEGAALAGSTVLDCGLTGRVTATGFTMPGFGGGFLALPT